MKYLNTIIFKTIDTSKEKIDHHQLDAMVNELQNLKALNLDNLDNYIEFNDVLKNLVSLQDETGSFPLVKDEHIPNDCFYGYVKEPTYIILKLLCEYNNPVFYPNIKKALDFCKKSKFRGHGYDAQTCQLENLTMLLSVNFEDFIDDELREIIDHIIDHYRQALALHQTNTGWGSMENEIKDLLRIVDKNKFIFYGTLIDEELRDSLGIDAYDICHVSLPNTEVIYQRGLASLSLHPGYETFAMLYEISDIDVEILDKYEGHRYMRKELFLSNNHRVYKVNAYIFVELSNQFEREMY